ncbi:MAG TPA: hypothetical protein VKC64_11315 [Burkholderiales bacterium]|nr:hypothetical protein [Burkholderiales bacterium]
MALPIVGKVEFQNSNAKAILVIDPDSAFVQLVLQSPTAPPFKIMELTNTGSLSLMDERARLDGTLGWCWLGGKGKTGALLLRNGSTQTVIELDAGAGNVYVGGNGAKGDILVFPASVTDNTDGSKASVHLDGGVGAIFLKNAGQNRVALDALNGNVHVGGNGAKGDLFVYSNSVTAPFADNLIGSNASIHLDGQDNGRIVVRRRVDQPDTSLGFKDAIVLDAKTGDITLDNADCAEEFEVADLDEATPGTVMVLGEGARLQPSGRAYDRKVVGIVSGAGDLRPGIVLGREAGRTDRRAIALAGRANCKVDAQYAPVEIGDLLTTSCTRGHAMKVVDEHAAFGAVIGKALAPLVSGSGLLPVLVALQ